MKVRSKLLLISLTLFIAIFLMQFISQKFLFERFYYFEKKGFLNKTIKEYEKVARVDDKGEEFIKKIEKEDCVILLYDNYMKEIEGNINLGGKMVMQLEDGKLKTFQGYGIFVQDGFDIGDRVKVSTITYSDGYTVITGIKSLDREKKSDIIYSGYGTDEKGLQEEYEGVISSVSVQNPRVERIKNALSMYLFRDEEIHLRSGEVKFNWEEKDYIISIQGSTKGLIIGIVPLERSLEITRIMNKFNLFIVAIALIIIFMVVIYFSKYISNPLIKMRNKAGEIAQMKFDYDLQIKRKDEFGELSESLETIARNLDKNITELNRTNEKLKVEYEERLRMESQQKNLLMNISHDLKTPLTVVKGYLKGSKVGIYDKDEVIDKSIDAVDEITDTIRGMIDLTRVNVGSSREHFSIFPLDEVVFECLDEVEEIFKGKRQRVEIDMVDDAFINMNRDEINQVLMNILSNASYHSKENASIKIGLMEKDEVYTLSVFNSGSHIPHEELTKIFTPFYKVERARNSGKGNGLGLSIVKGILEKNKIEYTISNKDGGVEFKMKLKGVALQ